MRVGVAPGTTAFVVRGPDLGGFRCLNCAPGASLQGPMVGGKLDLQQLGICPPDPLVEFLTNPFGPPRGATQASPAGSGPLVPVDPYGTDSAFDGALGVSWGKLGLIFGAALAGGLGLGFVTRRKRRR